MIGRHKFASAVPDSSDQTLILPSDHNADVLLGWVMTNRTGGVLTAGDIVAVDSANDASVVLADSTGARRQYVVFVSALPTSSAHAPATTINDLAQGLFLPVGAATVKVAGATTRGNYLRKSATTKALEDTGTAVGFGPPAGAIATALGSTGGAGTLPAIFHGSPVPDAPNFNFTFNGDFEIWGGGTATDPTGWSHGGTGASVAKDTTNKKIGSASAALTRSGADCFLVQNVAPIFHGVEWWKGKTVTVGAWVRATVASRARLELHDGNVEIGVSSFHSGSSNWEWLTATGTVTSSATVMNIALQILNGDTTAQVDGITFVVGSSVADFIPSGWRGRKATLLLDTGTGGPLAGVTNHYSSSRHSSGASDAVVQIPYACVIRRMHNRSNAAPGASQTYVYTLQKETVDTSLTATTSGASSQNSSNTVNEVECAATSHLSIKIVTSAGAAVATHATMLEIEEIP